MIVVLDVNRVEAEWNLGLCAVPNDLDQLTLQAVGVISLDADKRERRTLILADAQNQVSAARVREGRCVFQKFLALLVLVVRIRVLNSASSPEFVGKFSLG